MKRFFVLYFVVIGLFFSGASHAAFIADSGEPSYQTCDYVINQNFDDHVIVEMALDKAYYITSIQGFVDFDQEGRFYVNIYQAIFDFDENPGPLVYSDSVYLTGDYHGWAGPSGLNWYLAEGTYWISFYSDATSVFGGYARMGSFTGSVPNRLVELYTDQPSSQPLPLDAYWYTPLNLGVRIEGVEASVPEPGILILLSIGLIGLAGTRKKFKK